MTGLPTPNAVDAVAAVLIVVGTLAGLRHGLSGELAGVCGLVVAFAAGLCLYRPVGSFILAQTKPEHHALSQAVGFLSTVCLALLVMFTVRLLVRKLVQAALPRGVDRLAGLVAGLLGTAAFTALALAALNQWPHPGVRAVCGPESVAGTLVARHLPPWPCLKEMATGERTETGPPAEDPAAAAPSP